MLFLIDAEITSVVLQLISVGQYNLLGNLFKECLT